MHKIQLGAHLSISDGLFETFELAEQINADVVQIFVKSNRSWQAPDLNQKKINDLKMARKKYPKTQLVAHATYLINLATADQALATKSMLSLALELGACDAFGIPFLVLHPGSAKNLERNLALNLVGERLSEVLKKQKFHCKVLLENMAGQGTVLGTSFEELATIFNIANNKNVGYCLDTCHLFSAGYDIVKSGSEIIKEFNKICGIENLHMIHVNDSVNEQGSRVDRHANIGEGKIGKFALKKFIHQSNLEKALMVLETPLKDDGLGYKIEIESLR